MKKVIALILAVALMACLFIGCGGNKDDEILVMATNAEFPPYEYFDQEEIVGIDAEIARAVCEEMGYGLRIDNMEFGATIPAVTSGKADFVMAGMTVTEERMQSVDFSISYATGVQAIVVSEGSPITSVDDLLADGATYVVGVQQDTTGDIYCTGDLGDARVLRYSKGADAIQALVSGKVDCVVIDNEPAKSYVSANEGLTILDTEYIEEQYAAAFAKDSELTEEFNKALQKLIDDGTVEKIIGKYIQ